MKKPLFSLSAWLLCALISTLCAQVRIENSAANHTVAVGQAVTFTISGLSALKAPAKARAVVNMSQVSELPMPAGNADEVVHTLTASTPGTLLLAVDIGKGFSPADYRNCARSAVAVSPEKVVSSLEPAADVAAYWDSLKTSLQGVSAEPNLKLVSTKDGIEVYAFEIDAGGGELGTSAGLKAIGHMAKPVGDGPFPVLVNFWGAGTFESRDYSTFKYAKQGIMCWTLNPHPIPNDIEKAERDAIRNGVLKYYNQIGKEGPRQAVYFNGMFKRDYQLIQAIKQSPFWDKKHLVVHGFSQGGAQTIATAYLAPEVTAIAPCAPALMDIAGNLDGRAACWPYWVKERDSAPYEMARTFDLLNLAPLMHTPMLLGAGLYDATCPAAAQMAFYNRYAGPKELVFMPDRGHQTDKNWEAREQAFIETHLGLR